MKTDKPTDIVARRRQKLAELKQAGINLYPNGFEVPHTVAQIRKMTEALPPDCGEDDRKWTVAGRMMAINRFGKSAFIRLRDRTGQMQAYIRKDRVGDDTYRLFKQLDIGDFVGLTGHMFKTRTGEWTLLAEALTLLSKAVRPLPEKFHGLKDPEKRYRQRYLDLIMNQEVREIFMKRSLVIDTIRRFFIERDFLEVETPMMQVMPGGAEATPFVTHHNALGIDLYLRIAPELYLKRLVVGGFERVFEINRNFRNEGISTRHNPEFTMLEFYQAYATYEDLMALTEDLLRQVTVAVNGSPCFSFQGNEIDMQRPFARYTLFEALRDIGGVDPALFEDPRGLLDFAAAKGIQVARSRRHGKVITKLFDVLVEPKLIQPTFITGYPVEVSPLSRRSDQSPGLTERFEMFVAGYEIANGFSELNDPEDQHQRFEQQVADKQAGDEETHSMDTDYIEALEYGMPPTAGEGIGIDRLVMLLTDSPSIREVILFPHLKPQS
jgi:lysyl-tRNA synthetase class 2